MSKQVILDYEEHERLLEVAEKYKKLLKEKSYLIDIQYLNIPMPHKTISLPIPASEDLSPIYDELRYIVDLNNSCIERVKKEIEEANLKIAEHNKEKRWERPKESIEALQEPVKSMPFLKRLSFLFTNKLPQ